MDAPTAVKLASSLSIDYLTDVSTALDPVRATAIPASSFMKAWRSCGWPGRWRG